MRQRAAGRVMSQRDSGYERKERDSYETPEWVTLALVPHIPKRITKIYEPAAGSGKMVRALEGAGYFVEADDIAKDRDFLKHDKRVGHSAIITNPPYVHAQEFCEMAIALTCQNGFVAMLLRTDFDHAKSRARLFGSPRFAKKLVLRERIRWIDGSTGSPSFNHAWFMWDWHHSGAPVLAYH
jgi:hypothetical protein